ncbi:MAG: hypothetical protein ACYDH6_07305 [Acidimicrobiales bacterium]
MPANAVADAGGLLVLAGLLRGEVHDVDEILALDASSLLLAEYLTVRHEGSPMKARVDFGLAASAVAEWFPARGLAIEAALACSESIDLDSVVALALAESLGVPLVTKNAAVESSRVVVLRC